MVGIVLRYGTISGLLARLLAVITPEIIKYP